MCSWRWNVAETSLAVSRSLATVLDDLSYGESVRDHALAVNRVLGEDGAGFFLNKVGVAAQPAVVALGLGAKQDDVVIAAKILPRGDDFFGGFVLVLASRV